MRPASTPAATIFFAGFRSPRSPQAHSLCCFKIPKHYAATVSVFPSGFMAFHACARHSAQRVHAKRSSSNLRDFDAPSAGAETGERVFPRNELHTVIPKGEDWQTPPNTLSCCSCKRGRMGTAPRNRIDGGTRRLDWEKSQKTGAQPDGLLEISLNRREDNRFLDDFCNCT